ncbi:hypothetical protein PIROE2DRAFT_9537 [Piromyces sp. E2]|nr:hypothetical protein PIROE2DRAFT_9537 [Piromyces sp. E2]|eukprot:OUM63867.1 hypothetical protein PIROE2DRAFT_9537 [Piromyces sp. E2]
MCTYLIIIFIDIRGGSNFKIDATSAETVGDLKSQIQLELGCEVASEILTYNGLVLEDEYTLHDYNINEGSTVQLALRN